EKELFTVKPVKEDVSILILRDILRKTEEGFFEKVKEKNGFISSLHNFIKRVKILNIDPEQFLSITDTEKFTHILQQKCRCLGSIYEEYEKYKEKEKLYDMDDISLNAISEIENHPLFLETGVIVIDGFINLDPVTKSLLKNISIYHSSIDLYASVPFKNEHNEEFIKNEIIGDLTELKFIEGTSEFPSEEVKYSIKALCNNLYSDKKVLSGDIEGIKILNSPCIDYEIRETARIIKKKLFSRETVPEKIAIYIKDNDEYRPVIEEIFEETGIPAGINWKKSVITVPFIKDILNFLNFYIKDREREGITNLFSSIYLLPSGLLKKVNFEIDRISDSLIKAIRWNEPEEFPDIIKKHIKENEIFYDTDIDVFVNLLSSFKPSDIKSKKECFEKFLSLIFETDLKDNIIALYREGITDEYTFIRDINAFETLEKSLRNRINIEEKYGTETENINIENIYEELLEYLSGIEMENTEKDTGGVRILNPDLARGQYYDTVFILGVNEGIFPSVSSGNVIFDLSDHDHLTALGINLVNRSWELEREKIRFNLCMASAKKEIYISYRTCDERGEYMIKSSFLDDLSSLIDEDSFNRIALKQVYMRDRFNVHEAPVSYEEAIRKKSTLIGKENSERDDFIKDIRADGKEIDYINHASVMEYRRQKNPFFDAYDGMLGDTCSLEGKCYFSPSQFNSYQSCPFKYFMERIIGVFSDDDEAIDVMARGSFYHQVLKDYYTNNNGISLYNEQRLKEIFDLRVKELYDRTIPEKLFGFMKAELFSVISDFLKSDAENFTDYYEKTGFILKPYLLERNFTIKDSKIFIRGIVDRVDLEMTEQGGFTGKFVIYDYKNSSTKGIKECVEAKD
ncbi:MAG: PD-(D/E)XK nuclease family protein, partial [Candidatus Eremiobacterota bacterium]